jgi:hypothetical protein
MSPLGLPSCLHAARGRRGVSIEGVGQCFAHQPSWLLVSCYSNKLQVSCDVCGVEWQCAAFVKLGTAYSGLCVWTPEHYAAIAAGGKNGRQGLWMCFACMRNG